MFTALLILQVVLGLSIIALVLLQRGKGADMGAAFGAGASGTVFGAAGGGSFLTRVTAILAFGFFANSILLSSPLVLKPVDSSVSVTSVTLDDESATPTNTEEIVVEEIMDLPPADLMDAESLPLDAPTDDIPAMPDDVPAADAPPVDKPE
ncbi:Protein translocase membrane subunit SecG [hydrothermal vent metagenome]|uniref:Protein translocase membrane subunit SecG n=1 Tax=hydrothermal vent metagenome TaxID=652676 RepID=A0A3B0YZ34_9ZZZZ